MKRFFLLVFVILLFAIPWSTVKDEIEQVSETPLLTNITSIIDSETIKNQLDVLVSSFQSLIGRIEEALEGEESTPQQVDKPQLEEPVEHTFSIHNIEIGDAKKDVDAMLGEPKRVSWNEYGTNWYTYHEDYQNYLQVMFNEKDEVVGLYTNQDLISSTIGLQLGSAKETVLEQLGEPLTALRKGFILYQIQEKADYHLFEMDDSYVTVFYDQHKDDTVTALQIIEASTEMEKKDFYTVASEELKEGFEYQMFGLTNAARVNHSLRILTWDEHVRETARKHSLDMAENNYFSHTNLQGQSPFDRMKEDDLIFTLAGENLAYGQSSSIFAHEGLMNSMGHRENILKADYRYLGVGVAFNTENQPYYTQNYYSK